MRSGNQFGSKREACFMRYTAARYRFSLSTFSRSAFVLLRVLELQIRRAICQQLIILLERIKSIVGIKPILSMVQDRLLHSQIESYFCHLNIEDISMEIDDMIELRDIGRRCCKKLSSHL